VSCKILGTRQRAQYGKGAIGSVPGEPKLVVVAALAVAAQVACSCVPSLCVALFLSTSHTTGVARLAFSVVHHS